MNPAQYASLRGSGSSLLLVCKNKGKSHCAENLNVRLEIANFH